MRSSCTVTFARQVSSSSVFLAKGARQCPWPAAHTSGHYIAPANGASDEYFLYTDGLRLRLDVRNDPP